MTEPSRVPARFRPLRLAPRRTRRLLFLLGPLLWVVALVVLAFVVRQLNTVGIALLVLASSLVLALVLLGWARIARAREEREA
jgi:Na+/melibiose symporter-like transporter